MNGVTASPGSSADPIVREARIRDFLLTTVQHATPSPRSWTEAVHDHDELLWVSWGVASVRTPSQLHTLGTRQAFWVPRGTPHSIEAAAESTLQATFFADDVTKLGSAPTLMNLSPAVRELLLLNAAEPMPDDVRFRLQRLVIDLLIDLPVSPVELRMPVSPYLVRAAEAILSDPADQTATSEWAHRLGIPARRLSQAFAEQTGHSLTQWRIRARLRAAVVLLESGTPVVDTAARLGYASVSTFIEHFRTVLGSTPGAYSVHRHADL